MRTPENPIDSAFEIAYAAHGNHPTSVHEHRIRQNTVIAAMGSELLTADFSATTVVEPGGVYTNRHQINVHRSRLQTAGMPMERHPHALLIKDAGEDIRGEIYFPHGFSFFEPTYSEQFFYLQDMSEFPGDDKAPYVQSYDPVPDVDVLFVVDRLADRLHGTNRFRNGQRMYMINHLDEEEVKETFSAVPNAFERLVERTADTVTQESTHMYKGGEFRLQTVHREVRKGTTADSTSNMPLEVTLERTQADESRLLKATRTWTMTRDNPVNFVDIPLDAAITDRDAADGEIKDVMGYLEALAS